MQVAHERDGPCTAPAQRGGKVALPDAGGLPGHLLLPVPCAVAAQVGLGVLHEQRLDVVDVASHLPVVGPAPQGHQGPGDDVDEPPCEFLERRGIALARQLVGDPGRHLGDAREIADGVVAGRNPGVAKMEHVERIGAPGAPGLGIHPSQQPGIAFRIEHDHHVAAANVLGNQQLGQPGLADARRAQHQRVTGPLAEVHPDRLFPGLDGMQGRVAARLGPGRKGAPAAALA